MTDQPIADLPSQPDPLSAASSVPPGTSAATGGDDVSLAQLLRISSEITGQVNAILDPDLLLNTVIPLLRDGFGLYYVHVYTLDLGERVLRLRAGYGEPGRQMLARGHSIPLDVERSLVARAARDRAPIVVNDVTQRQDHLPNPLLPETRSELALPMLVGDAVLGVFDIQHSEPEAFPALHVGVYFGLAGQIATALQNARFIERVEESLYQSEVRYAVSRALGRPQAQRGVLQAVAAQAALLPGAGLCLALETDDQAAALTTVVAVAPAHGRLPAALQVGAQFGVGDGAASALVDLDMAALWTASDPATPPEAAAWLIDHGLSTLLAEPVVSGNERLGVLLALMGDAVPDSRVRFAVRTLAEQSAGPLVRARLRDELSLTQFSVQRAPVAMLWIRSDGTLRSANDTACELLGYTSSELLALGDITEVMSDATPADWREQWGTLAAAEHLVRETYYLAKSGRRVPVEETISFLAYADEELACIFAHDIGERIRAQEARDRYTVRLSTAAEISEQVGAILDPDRLLATVIPLLKERFGLYHAHVYVLQDGALVLRSGYGRIGAMMVRQGHSISMDHPHSLVARAARSRSPSVVNDVASSPDFLPNLLLPETRSEVAVPIVIGDQVLGVFDVQSDRMDAFGEADVDVFTTLSGQLANALYSALLFDEQRTTQEELRDAVGTVRAVFDAMTEGVLVTDVMGKIEDVNESAVRLFGYSGHDDLVGRSTMELVARSSWSRLSGDLRQTIESGRGSVAEYTMVRQDGSFFDAEYTAALLWDEDGVPRGIVSITRDITERKQDRLEIARFRALAENAVDAIMMTDFAGQVTYANPAAAQLFGYVVGPAGIVGRPLTDLWTQPDVTMLLMEVLPAAGGDGWQGEVTQVRQDGTQFDASLTFFSVMGEQGRPVSAATIVRDITGRIQAEAALRRFTVQLRTAADVSAQVNAILDPTALLEAVVPLVQERFSVYHLHVYTLDVERNQLVMQVGSGEAGRIMRQRGHGIRLDREPSLVALAARTQETVVVDDVTLSASYMPNPLLPDTRSEVAIPLLVGDQLVGVLDVQDDQPGRFGQNEVDALRTLAGQIAIALQNARSFEAIELAAERLREVDRLKSEFLANMSHELRTPLNSILGYAEVMLMGIDGELNAEMHEDVTAIFENGQHLLKLINDILDLTKIEAGRMQITTAPVDVLQALEQATSHNQGLLLKDPKPVTLTVAAPTDLPTITVDPMRFAQVLNNLVSNAIKFTDKGEVSLSAEYDGERDSVVIDVQDSGVGIAKEDIPKLFQRFRQVDGSSTRRAEGSGLGLAISKHLVEMHGGDLTVVSEVGVGSTFTILLPVGAGDAAGADDAGDVAPLIQGM